MRNRRVERSRFGEVRRRSLRLRPDLAGGSSLLEARTLLAVVTVTTTTDEFDVPVTVTVPTLGAGGPDGTISLREAVVAATNTSGATEIDLPAGTYNLASIGTGELRIGNIAGQNITIKGLGTPANTVINQAVAGNRIFNYDDGQRGSIAGSLLNLTLQGATNVNRVFGGGAILAGGPGDSLSLANCVVQNNSTSNGAGGIGRNGAGISYSGGGNLTIANSKFLNNTAGGNSTAGSVGGAIAYNNSTNAGNLSISNTVFDHNKATGPGSGGTGAAAGALFVGGAGTHTITASTFTNNSAGASNSQGGAILAGGGTLNITGTRFFNDTAATGSGIDNTGATLTANNNWWGADAFPGPAGTDSVVTTGGSTTVLTRLALALSPGSSTIGTNASTTLTAKVVSTSAPTVAFAGTALDGLNLTFAPGTLGSVSPSSVALASGAASTTFSSGSAFGTTSPSVTLDNGTKSTTINIVGAPTANAQAVNVAHDTAKGITLTGSDPNSPPRASTFAIATNPAHGTLSGFNAATGAVTYAPGAGYHGADSFTFTVSNGFATSSPATVSLTVAAGVPTANPQSVNVAFNTAKGITLTGSDPDVPALPLTFTVATNPGHGTLSGTAPNLTYTPDAGYFGPDSFTFTVSNGTNTGAPATVSIGVAQAVPATVSGTVGVAWGSSGTASLQTNADGLRLLPAGRNTDLPWLGINKLSITLSRSATLSPGDVTVTGINVANYGPVTISGSRTSYTITLSRPIGAADRVTVTIGNAGIATFTRRLDVVPGDLNDDGAVTMQDAIGIRNEFLGFVGAVPTIFGDIDGDGIVDVNDYNATRRLLGTVLP